MAELFVDAFQTFTQPGDVLLDVGTKSTMPGYAERLTADEIADTVAYLLTLRE